MAGNPNWWNMNIPPPPPPPPPSSSPSPPPPLSHALFQYPHPHHQYGFGSSPSHPLSSFVADNSSHDQLPPQSWSQLLLGGLSGEEADSYKSGPSFYQTRKFGNWPVVEDQSILSREPSPGLHVKQEQVAQHGNPYIQHEELPAGHKPATVWPTAHMIPVSSPGSCVTTLSSSTNSVLDFSSNISKGDHGSRNNQNLDHSSSECNSTATVGACKKARVQSGSNQPLKVRKEKLGDRITALHQLVSPFGKALSSPYLGNASGNLNHQHSENDGNNLPKDLRSRGLCLVPVSCTMQVGNDNGADYWAPAAFGGSF
ncbi:hypothetical protein CRG98_027420 [Punica granatum]|uniref:Transcription factor bHLH68-like n=1 Tax=Punica granatum TaxID=22663 RepID=A0A2I0J7F9_PUNGR|nr:hypothetical protein CRG98_027420 [Punica granatum]